MTTNSFYSCNPTRIHAKFGGVGIDGVNNATRRVSTKQSCVTNVIFKGFTQVQRHLEMVTLSKTRLTFQFSLRTGILTNANYR